MDFPLQFSANELFESYFQYEKSYKDNRINLRMLIPAGHAGQIIGSNGKNIQSITNYYHVVLQFSKCKSPRGLMRLFQIRGKAEDCAKACTNCFEILVQRYNDLTHNGGIDFVLPDALIHYLKEGGKKENGENVFQEIALQTSTEIRIMSHYLPNSTERIVRISIPNSRECIQQFYLAVKSLTQQLDENLTLAMCAPNNKFYRQEEEEDDLVFADTKSIDEAQEIYSESTKTCTS